MAEIKVIAFDLDGTLTQHKSKLQQQSKALLDALGKKYKLLMVGAGQCRRIFEQMNRYPIDIIGNYGMQYCRYNQEMRDLEPVFDMQLPCDRESVEARVTALRQRYGFTEFAGDSVEYHSSGCVTFPILGTAAKIEDKLAFDPDRKKRSVFYQDVKQSFSDYSAFIGGSSSFDFAPFPYDKYYALDKYCRDKGLLHENLVYVGDDYGAGGNDEAVYVSDFKFICIDDYTRLRDEMKEFI